MKAYRKPSGVYIELEDVTPVSDLLVRVIPKPSISHVFSDNWASDPMNPLVCWRLKTSQELDSELVLEANYNLDLGKMERLRFEVAYDLEKRLRVLEAKPAITKLQYRDALVNAYKSL